MSLRIVTGEDAHTLRQRRDFLAGWRALSEACPWGTALQDPGFVNTWYEVYRSRFEPVLAVQAKENGQLVGLLPLAVARGSHTLVAAGNVQAEYQTWLATSEESDSFIDTALSRLLEMFPGGPLVLRYVPPGTPLEWTRRGKAAGPRA